MIIKNVRVFDGKPLGKSSNIHITSDGLIHAITETHQLADSADEHIVDGKGMMAVPGITDAHKHIWQSAFKGFAADFLLPEYLDRVNTEIGQKITADDLYHISLYGYRRAIEHGVTTVFDYAHIINSPEHSDAAIQAANESGINVLFFHATSTFNRDAYYNDSTQTHLPDIERIVSSYAGLERVKIGMGIRGPETARMEVNKADIELAASLNSPVSMHIGSAYIGTLTRPIEQLFTHGLLSERLNLVHCSTLSDEEYKMIADARCLVSMTPEAELQTALGNPAVRLLADHPEARWSVGTDIPTGNTDSMIFQQRLLLQYYRGFVNKKSLDQMEFPAVIPYKANDFFFDSTKHANIYAGFNVSSKIEPGYKACLSLYDLKGAEEEQFARNPAFYFLNEASIDTVVANGKLLIDNKKWVKHDMDALDRKIKAIVQRILK